MLQADSVQFDFPPPPTLDEYVFAWSLLWLIELTMIAVGAYGLYRSKNDLVKLLAAVPLALGFGLCFLMGWSFALNRRHRFAWLSDDDINYWIDICLGLMIWGTAPLVFWVGRKIGKRSVKRTEPDAN